MEMERPELPPDVGAVLDEAHRRLDEVGALSVTSYQGQGYLLRAILEVLAHLDSPLGVEDAVDSRTQIPDGFDFDPTLDGPWTVVVPGRLTPVQREVIRRLVRRRLERESIQAKVVVRGVRKTGPSAS